MDETQYEEEAIPRRPFLRDPSNLYNIATQLLSEVRMWLEEKGETFSDQTEVELHRELCDLLERVPTWDGYALARDLEDAGWEPNAALVEIFQPVEEIGSFFLREETIRWAASYGLTLTLPVRTLVKFNLMSDEPERNGKVVGLEKEMLCYTIEAVDGEILTVPFELVEEYKPNYRKLDRGRYVPTTQEEP